MGLFCCAGAKGARDVAKDRDRRVRTWRATGTAALRDYELKVRTLRHRCAGPLEPGASLHPDPTVTCCETMLRAKRLFAGVTVTTGQPTDSSTLTKEHRSGSCSQSMQHWQQHMPTLVDAVCSRLSQAGSSSSRCASHSIAWAQHDILIDKGTTPDSHGPGGLPVVAAAAAHGASARTKHLRSRGPPFVVSRGVRKRA